MARGCGSRIGGGVYASTTVAQGRVRLIVRTSKGELKQQTRPLSSLLYDPPIPADLDGLGVCAQGVTVRMRVDGMGQPILINGEPVYDVFDLIGAEHYPYFPDFYEEGYTDGFSRRFEGAQNWEKVSVDSKMFFIFPRGYLLNYGELLRMGSRQERPCPTDDPDHLVIPEGMQDYAPMCISRLWQVLVPRKGDRPGVRQLANGNHYLHELMPEGFVPEWQPAICMWSPITRFEVIKDPLGEQHKSPLDILSKLGNGLAYLLMEE